MAADAQRNRAPTTDPGKRPLVVLVAAPMLGVITLPGRVHHGRWLRHHLFALGASKVASITYRQQTMPVEYAAASTRSFACSSPELFRCRVSYAWASRLGGLSFRLPALALAAVSVRIWAWYTSSRKASGSAMTRAEPQPSPGRVPNESGVDRSVG